MPRGRQRDGRERAGVPLQADVAGEIPCHGTVVGDIAWGGNWFFLVAADRDEMEEVERKQGMYRSSDVLSASELAEAEPNLRAGLAVVCWCRTTA